MITANMKEEAIDLTRVRDMLNWIARMMTRMSRQPSDTSVSTFSLYQGTCLTICGGVN